MDSYDVRFWDIKKVTDTAKGRWRVRWGVAGRPHCKSFPARSVAEGFLTSLKEPEIEHFWLHVEADEEHGGKIFDLLEKHCTTNELKELAVHWAYEGARMRWFYFDGIFMHYENGYALA